MRRTVRRTIADVPVPDGGPMCVVLVETLRGLRVITSAVRVEMTASPVVTMVLVTDDSATASITMVSCVIATVVTTAAALRTTTARLRRAVPGTASVVGSGLLLAILLV